VKHKFIAIEINTDFGRLSRTDVFEFGLPEIRFHPKMV